MFKRVTGTRDILPEEALEWQAIEEISRRVFSLYGYLEIRPPVIEDARLFNRSLGEASDIVQKQMFVIQREDEAYALRPEATASIARAYIENNLDKTTGFLKSYYLGPMFRAERPQKGRQRQFHHIGCEAIGSYAPELDVEVISLADALLKALFITGYKIKINSLGCLEDKKGIAQLLHKTFKNKLSELCPDCHRRFETNPLRILDCKEPQCRKIIEDAGITDTHLCVDCRKHFSAVKGCLDTLKLEYEVSPHLVRGLDYYTRTVFEITHPDLGAQDAIGAGGRYDNLIKELDGPDLGAVGFALGVERLLLVTKSPGYKVTNRSLVYIIALGDAAKKESIKLLQKLRQENIAADTDYENKSLKGSMRKASDLGAKYVLIIGDNELKTNSVTIKEMATGKQLEITQDKIVETLKK